ncbi:MAG: hypothetical protein ABIG93_04605 [archaeon]|nr:hypothetical protein [Nanoarchaeota archaeon]
MSNENYLDNNVYTSRAKDVVEMHGKTLTDYTPVLVKGVCSSGEGSNTVSDKALEKLVEEAQDKNCEFVTDLKPASSAARATTTCIYLGTGLVPKNQE